MIRMIDIAQEAGVSRTAVSFILNGRGKDLHLSDAIIGRVQSTALRLGYIRNELANSMVTGRSRTIGIISTFRGFMIPTIQGCLDEAYRHNCPIQLIPLDSQDINHSIRQALEYRVAGLCLLATLSEEQLTQIEPQFRNLEIPTVGFTPETKHMPFNQLQSAAVGTEYLIRLGHRRIIFLSSTSDIGKERENGYRESMRTHGLPEIIHEVHLNHQSPDYQAVIRQEPDAVQCADDSIALDFLHYCYLKKYHVPECFSVLGFGNVECCAVSSPRLASVNEPYYQIGKIRFRHIHRLIQRKSVPDLKLPVGKVIRRESVGRPPHRSPGH